MISFACPACNHKHSVKEELAGKRGTCPHCKKPLLVPVPDRPVDAAPQAVANPLTQADTVTAATILLSNKPPSSEVGAAKLDFLAPPQKPDELGRLGSYRVLKVLGAAAWAWCCWPTTPYSSDPSPSR